jgi:4-amino-4-deoxy-L-arabinose transferase-like glycosyltransferase
MRKNTFVLLLFACVGVYLVGSFMIPLMDIDASQYASISREMLARNSFLQVFDLGKDYLDKPPMLFWLSALSMKIFGVHDWAYRLPSLLFLGVALYATYQFAQLFYSTQIARLATIILACSQAFFLIAHDVRTDTMLVGWVMLSIYLLAKWSEGELHQIKGSTPYFFFAVVAIAGGMMTKGPIALVVPVLALVPHWVSNKQWSFFYKPIYIPGIILLAILLFPMSWGLYQQYDLHPGKLINDRPIKSGLEFYYWTQSFGRYTGQNFYKEMGYFTFLLENMFWSFLPWIFVFLWAIVAKGYVIITEGIFKAHKERISFFGFILTYLVLSSSQAQLPHYIFVVFPLAAILTASHWDQFLWENKTLSKFSKGLYGFHFIIFTILIIAASLIAFVPFGRIHLFVLGIGLLSLGIVSILLFSHQTMGKKWFYISVVIMLGVNTFMNTHFYPNLLKYQWGNQLADIINNRGWDKENLVLYKIPNSNALHFYGLDIFPNVTDSLKLKEGEWVVTDYKNDSSLRIQFPKSVQQYKSNRFHVTMLSLPFLNPATRQNELTPFEVIELKK